MGKWIHKAEKPHECTAPMAVPDIEYGSIWQCSCGRNWEYSNYDGCYFLFISDGHHLYIPDLSSED